MVNASDLGAAVRGVNPMAGYMRVPLRLFRSNRSH